MCVCVCFNRPRRASAFSAERDGRARERAVMSAMSRACAVFLQRSFDAVCVCGRVWLCVCMCVAVCGRVALCATVCILPPLLSLSLAEAFVVLLSPLFSLSLFSLSLLLPFPFLLSLFRRSA